MGRIIIVLGLLAAAGGALFVTAADTPSSDALFGLWRLRHVALGAALLGLALLVLVLGRRIASPMAWAAMLPAVLLLGAVEAAGRAGLIDWRTLLEGASTADTNAPGWSLEPNQSTEGETYQDIASMLGIAHDAIPFSYVTDAHGFRNAPGTKADVIVLGDSIVLGGQVARDQTVAGVLEAGLGKPVMQAALLGISIQEQHDMLLASDVPLAGAHVIQMMFEGNDLLDSRTYRQPPGDASAPSGSSLIKLIWDRAVRLSNPRAPYMTCEIDGAPYAFLWTRKSFAGVEDEFDPITEAIQTFRAALAAKGASYALVFVPTKYRVLQDRCTFPETSEIAVPADNLSGLPKQISRFAAETGIPFLDLTDTLSDADTIPWFWGDTHWNTAGHAAAGRAIAAWIRSE